MSRITRRMVDADEGFAMIFTILLTVIIVASSIAVAGLLMSQTNPSLFSKKNVRTIDAASAGLQAALGQLRNTTVAGAGDLTKLPCSDPSDRGGVSIQTGSPTQTTSVAGDQLTGTVANDGTSSDTASYRTVIVYFANDPTSHEADSSLSWWTNNAIPCKAGIVKSVPTYAFIQSYGAGIGLAGLASTTTGNRTVHAIYQFQATNSNTQGGRMPEYITGSQDKWCMDAGTSPAVGTTMTMQPCLALGTAQQTWLYRNDLTIMYGGNVSLNLCIENMSGVAELETCTTPAPPDPTSGVEATYPFASTDQQNQEWAFNDNGHLSAPLSPFTGSSGGNVAEGNESGSQCLFPGTTDPNTQSVAGAAVTIAVCDGNTTGDTAWNPDPQAGAGKSGGNVSGVPGSPTQQYVNYAEFGRCLDITGQNVGADHLIDYPCKQAPNACLLTWNQVWYYTAVANGYGTMWVYGGGSACSNSGQSKYCLTAPTSGNYVTVSPCAATPGSNQLWDPTGNILGNYPASYLLISQLNSQCMAADPDIQPTFGSSTIVLTSCSSPTVPSITSTVPNPTYNSLLLKWNAPPSNPTPGLRDIQEDQGSGDH